MRDYFDLDARIINLNSGTMSVTPRDVQHQITEETNTYNLLPAMSLFETWARLWEVQNILAKYFGADPNHLFLRPNVTYVLNDILLSLKLPKGSEVLTCDWEYGAIVNILKWKCQNQDLNFRSFEFKPSQCSSDSEILNHIERQLSKTTSLLMLSHVMTGNGLVLPVEEIGKLCRRKGVKFVVDGAHGAGALDLKFSALSHVDAYGTNLHKWMMGPKGTGFGWIHPELRDHLIPCFAGWTSFTTPLPFQGFLGDRFSQQWMMNSTNSFQAMLALPHVIRFWQEHGETRIRNRQQELRDLAHKSIASQTKWKSLSEFNASMMGPMIAFELPDHLANQGYRFMFELCRNQGLLIAMTSLNGRYAMRIAPQIYNTEQEIDKASRILASMNH